MDEMTITIRVKKDGDKWSSTHELIGVEPLVAGLVLIDVGRDILVGLAVHQHEHHQHKEANDGHALH